MSETLEKVSSAVAEQAVIPPVVGSDVEKSDNEKSDTETQTKDDLENPDKDRNDDDNDDKYPHGLPVVLIVISLCLAVFIVALVLPSLPEALAPSS